MEGALVLWRSEVFEPPHAMAEMNSYYKWCMFFLSAIGLWPYSNSKFRLLHNGFVSLVTWTSVISQFVAFFAADRNLFQQLRDISIAAITLAVFTRYHTSWYRINDIKAYLDQFRQDWETNNVEVLRIMQIYAFHGRRLVIFFAAFFYPGLCIIILYNVSPIILDKIVPLNESRPIQYPVHMEFLIEEEQHRIFGTSLFFIAIIIDVTILVGTESIMIMFSLHVAGLFGIASYYFEKAVLAESAPLHHPRKCTSNESISYIATGVLIHRRALQNLRDGSEKSKMSYSVLIILGMIIVSISLFCLSVTVLQLSDIRETIFSAVVLFAVLGYMFWLNLAVEYIIDSAGSISLTTYSSNWYKTSITTQKLLQMIILKSNKSVSFNFFSVITPSMANFAEVLKVAVSYFTVLLSFQ